MIAKPTYEELEERIDRLNKELAERTRVAEALRDSEEKYRQLFEMESDAIFLIDNETGRILEVNAAATPMYGYTREEILSKKNTELSAEPDDTRRATLEHRPVVPVRFHRKKDGTVFPVEIMARHATWRGREVHVAAIRDITERLQAQDQIRRQRSFLRKVIDSNPNFIYVKDREGRIVLANGPLAENYGLTVEDLTGKTAFELVPDARIAEAMRRDDMEILSGRQEKLQREEQYVDQLGNRRWAYTVKLPLRDQDGAVEQLIGVSTDITLLKKVEEELASTKARLEHLISCSPAVIYSCEPGGNYAVTFMSRNVEAQLGYSARDFLGNPDLWVENIHPEDAADVQEGLTRLFEAGHHTWEYRFRHKDGTYRWMHDRSRVVHDSEGRPIEIVGYWTDITRERQLEEELFRAQKLESVGILAAGIAHDFNNILTGISGNIGLAKIRHGLEPGAFELLDEAEKAVLRARQLTQQLLTFSRGGTPITKTISLAGLLRDAATFALRGSNVRCDFFVPEDCWPVKADEGQISQVVNNLIINAQQAMPEGGVVTLRADNVMAGAELGIPVQPGRYVHITVGDHGTGISPEHLQRVFDPYFSTKAKGRGLGLAVTYSIIQKHGGHISVASELGIGTTFHIYLPASVERRIEEREKETGKVPSGQGRILVMDDEEIVLDVAQKILRHLGYEVYSAKEGREAVEMYRKARESGRPFDAVILDLTVPGGMGGKEAMEQLMKLDPAVKGIVSSGYSDDPVVADFKDYGFSGVISKPYQIPALSRTLHRVLVRG